MKKVVFLICIVLFSIVSVFSQIKILSGLEGGTYNEFANNMKSVSSQDIEVLTSGGSKENVEKLLENNGIDITFLQYDVLLESQKEHPDIKENVKVYLPIIFLEEIHLITLKENNINTFNELEGKKVGIGTLSQGTNVTATNLKNETGVNWEDVEIATNSSFDALMNGEVDAFFYVGGAPIAMLNELPDDVKNKLKLIPIKSKKIPIAYIRQKISASTYSWLDEDISTYSVITLFVVKIHQNEVSSNIEKLYADIEKNVAKLQKEGHKKWNDVYENYRRAEIAWPFYVTENK